MRAKGFTLIELLVVVAVIGLLASVILTSLSSVKTKSGDSTRKSALSELQAAVELYYNSHGAYPSTGGTWYSNSPNGGNRTDWIPGLVADKDIGQLPVDPNYAPSACGGWGGTYLYISDGINYKILAHCPQNSMVASTPASDPFYDPIRPTWAWQVSSPGGTNVW